MKITSARCPTCGASISIDSDKKRQVCPFCDTEMCVEHEESGLVTTRRGGYAFERGRMDAQTDGADPALIQNISALRQKVDELDLLRSQLNIKVMKRDSLKRSSDEAAKALKRVFLPSLVVFAALFVLTPGVHPALRLLAGLVSGAAAYGLLYVFRNWQLKRSLAAYAGVSDECDALNSQVQDIVNSSGFHIVPDQYRNKDALNYIYSALLGKRALNLHQAIVQYEEAKYRNEVNRLHRQQNELRLRQADLQRQQLEAQERSADALEEQNRQLKRKNSLETALTVGGAVYAGVSIAKKLNKIIRL